MKPHMKWSLCIGVAVPVIGTSVLILPLVVAALFSPPCHHPELSRKLDSIGGAINLYIEQHGTFPPAATYDKQGKPLLSWRVALLPYLGEGELFQQFRHNEAWDSPHNHQLLTDMPRVYRPGADQVQGEPFITPFLGFVGPGATFEGNSGKSPGDFPHEGRDLILCVVSQKSVPWTKPEDLSYHPHKPVLPLTDLNPGLIAISTRSGALFLQRSQRDEQSLRNWITGSGKRSD